MNHSNCVVYQNMNGYERRNPCTRPLAGFYLCCCFSYADLHSIFNRFFPLSLIFGDWIFVCAFSRRILTISSSFLLHARTFQITYSAAMNTIFFSFICSSILIQNICTLSCLRIVWCAFVMSVGLSIPRRLFVGMLKYPLSVGWPLFFSHHYACTAHNHNMLNQNIRGSSLSPFFIFMMADSFILVHVLFGWSFD